MEFREIQNQADIDQFLDEVEAGKHPNFIIQISYQTEKDGEIYYGKPPAEGVYKITRRANQIY